MIADGNSKSHFFVVEKRGFAVLEVSTGNHSTTPAVSSHPGDTWATAEPRGCLGHCTSMTCQTSHRSSGSSLDTHSPRPATWQESADSLLGPVPSASGWQGSTCSSPERGFFPLMNKGPFQHPTNCRNTFVVTFLVPSSLNVVARGETRAYSTSSGTALQLAAVLHCPLRASCCCPTQLHLLSKPVRSPFPTLEFVLPVPEQTHPRLEEQHPPSQLSLGSSNCQELSPSISSWIPGSKSGPCSILVKTDEDLGFYCQVPEEI